MEYEHVNNIDEILIVMKNDFKIKNLNEVLLYCHLKIYHFMLT
jgi:hypothetical protein